MDAWIGISLPPDALLDAPVSQSAAELHSAYGGAKQMLLALRGQGVGSVELRALQRQEHVWMGMPCAERIWAAGLRVSIHASLSPRGLETALLPLLSRAVGEQGTVCVTVHAMKTPEDTALRLCSWSDAAPEGVLIALENERLRGPDKEHCTLARVGAAVSALSRGNVGLCWDMGHYAYNRIMDNEEQAVPPESILRHVIHTHIHGLVGAQTHYPADQMPERITRYIRALQASGYRGLYNLELEAARFAELMPFREGIERSVRFMKELLFA